MSKRWLKQQKPTWWGSPTNSGHTGRPGWRWGARATRTYSHTDRPLPAMCRQVQGGMLGIRASSPGSQRFPPQLLPAGEGGDELFLMTISPSFFFSPDLPCSCWRLPAGAGAIPTPTGPGPRGPPGPLLPCLGHRWTGGAASPNSHPPPCGLAAVPTGAGSSGAVPCAPIPGVPWHPWDSGDHGSGERCQGTGILWAAALGRVCTPCTAPPHTPSIPVGVNGAGNVLPQLQ